MVEEIKPGRGVGIAPGPYIFAQAAAAAAASRTNKNVVELRLLTFQLLTEARGITPGQGFNSGFCLLVIAEPCSRLMGLFHVPQIKCR